MQKNIQGFKYLFSLISLFVILIPEIDLAESFSVKLKNSLNIARPNEIVKINAESLIEKKPNFNFDSFTVYEDKKEIFFEKVLNRNTNKQEILLLISFEPGETKEIIFTDSVKNKKTIKLTKAYLGQKTGYEKKEGFFTGGYFQSVNQTKVPSGHFAHDALYQFEGPGWESEKVGYRLYLDERNRTDIFGKKISGLFLDITGKNDLVSDGNESYQKMLDWGRDIFKVGNSLGIGSIATFYNNKVVTVTEIDSTLCMIFDGNLVSEVETTHYGWNLDKKYNVTTRYSIKANSRITEVNVLPDKGIENLCTGLAKHENTEFIVSKEDKDWGYISIWGVQTLENDNLGIAVFYSKSSLVEISGDDLSHFVILKLRDKKLTYYFTAAWEQERGGIKSKEEFLKYLDDELIKLNNPTKVVLN